MECGVGRVKKWKCLIDIVCEETYAKDPEIPKKQIGSNPSLQTAGGAGLSSLSELSSESSLVTLPRIKMFFMDQVWILLKLMVPLSFHLGLLMAYQLRYVSSSLTSSASLLFISSMIPMKTCVRMKTKHSGYLHINSVFKATRILNWKVSPI